MECRYEVFTAFSLYGLGLPGGLVALSRGEWRLPGIGHGSPVVSGGKVFVLAADEKTYRLSYSTPCVITVEGRKMLVFTNWQHGFTVIDPKGGAVLGELSVFDTEVKERAISSPIVWEDLVIGTCGFTTNPKHCVAVRVGKDGSLTEVWRIEKAVPHIPTPLIVEDLLYLWDDKGLLTCVDPATGKIFYNERVPTRGTTFGSPVSDGKTIFCTDEGGNVHAVAVGKEFEVLAMNKLGELCRSTPAMSGGMMYVRTFEHVIAISGE